MKNSMSMDIDFDSNRDSGITPTGAENDIEIEEESRKILAAKLL